MTKRTKKNMRKRSRSKSRSKPNRPGLLFRIKKSIFSKKLLRGGANPPYKSATCKQSRPLPKNRTEARRATCKKEPKK